MTTLPAPPHPPRRRRAWWLAAPLVLGLLAVGGPVSSRPAPAGPPAAFVGLTDRCRTFTKAKAWLGYDGQQMLVHADAGGEWAADVFAGPRRYYWDGSALWLDGPTTTPRVISGAAEVASDLWAGCRSGFDGAIWTQIEDPDSIAEPTLGGATTWAKVALPYTWAQGVDIYVGMTRSSGILERVIFGSDASGWRRVGVTEIDWQASFPPQALDANSAPYPPPKHPNWIHTPYDELEQFEVIIVGGSEQ